MANLIPPDAKKAITFEYWIRVITVWLIMIGLALIAVALLKLPTFVLVQNQLNSFYGAYEDARENEEAFETAQQTIDDANHLSTLLAQFSTTTNPSQVMEILDEIAGSGIVINEFKYQRSESKMESLTVVGIASTRFALANFSDEIERHPLFEKAELPISNLAKDKDIIFNIAITPATEEN